MNAAATRPDESKTLWLPSPEPFEIKFASEGDKQTCEVEGYASIFGALDYGNDIVAKGAFAKSLKKRRNASGQWLIPMYFGHVHSSVPVGVWTDIGEDSKGLKVKGPIIIESPEARQLAAVLRAGAAMGLSIGYRCLKRKYIAPDGKEVDDWCSGATRRLDEVDLREISFTPMPMLDAARLTSVKGDDDPEEQDRAEAKSALLIHGFGLGIKHLRQQAAFRALAQAMRSAKDPSNG